MAGRKKGRKGKKERWKEEGNKKEEKGYIKKSKEWRKKERKKVEKSILSSFQDWRGCCVCWRRGGGVRMEGERKIRKMRREKWG